MVKNATRRRKRRFFETSCRYGASIAETGNAVEKLSWRGRSSQKQDEIARAAFSGTNFSRYKNPHQRKIGRGGMAF